MSYQNNWKAGLMILAGFALLIFQACDNERNVHAGNLVTVEGYVYVSPANRTGVADITVIIEKSEESSTPAVIPDIFVETDVNGRWEARFTLSYPDEGGGVMDITPQYIEESMRILMMSSEKGMLDLGSGYTFQAGKKYSIRDVFLSEFQ